MRTGLRTAHLLAFGALYGGHVYAAGDERLVAAWAATATTGGALLLLDAVREPASLVQVRGLAAFVKIALAVAVLALGGRQVALLTLAAVIGAVSSHMPGAYRYYSPWHGRVIGSREKG